AILWPSALHLPLPTHGSCDIPRQLERNGGAAALAFAGGVNFSAMRARNGAHDEQAQSGSLHLKTRASGNAIETFEDAFEFGRGDADAAVGDAQRDMFVVWNFDAHGDIHLVTRILHGVIEQV